MFIPYTAPCNGIRNLGKICMWNPESWVLESGVQLKESGLPLAIGIENPSSTDEDWNRVPESGIRDVESRIPDYRGFSYMR